MNVSLRGAGVLPRRIVVNRRSLRGLGDGPMPCQWPTPGATMYYPPCEGTPPGQTPAPGPYDHPEVNSVWDVPGLMLPYASCLDQDGYVIENSSCVDANLAIEQENMARQMRYSSDPAWAATFWDGSQDANPTTPPVVVNTASQSPPGQTQAQTNVARGGSLSLQNLSTGNAATLKVGDNWRISISGATPNAPVSVNGGKNGSMASTPMGSTDANGNFVLTGTITPDEVGLWAEQWYVGQQNSGLITFTVPDPDADLKAAQAQAAQAAAAAAAAAQAAATQAAKQAAADPTNPQAQAAAEQAATAATVATQNAATTAAAANAAGVSGSDNSTLYWIAGGLIGAGILYSMVNR